MNKELPPSSSHYLTLVLSVLCIGTSGPLGRLIHISPGVIICIRSLIAFLILFLLLKLSGKSIYINNRKTRNYILLSGVFLAAHWITYFYALQVSTVALAMLSMFTYPVITVLVEPFYVSKPFKFIQIPVAVIALIGIYIMLPDFDISNQHTLGILLGLLSAFLYAGRNLLLKKHATGENGLVVMCQQLLVVVVLTLPFFFFKAISIFEIKEFWYYLLFLGVITTAMGHSFFVKSLRHFSASTVGIISNFTPVVGIILGIIFLQESLSQNIVIGGSLILFTALLEVWIGIRKK